MTYRYSDLLSKYSMPRSRVFDTLTMEVGLSGPAVGIVCDSDQWCFDVVGLSTLNPQHHSPRTLCNLKPQKCK